MWVKCDCGVEVGINIDNLLVPIEIKGTALTTSGTWKIWGGKDGIVTTCPRCRASVLVEIQVTVHRLEKSGDRSRRVVMGI